MRFFGLAHPCECGQSPIGSGEVTAADRAAATVQHIQCPQKASPERGGARRAGGGVRSPAPHVRGGSVSRRGLTQLPRNRRPTSQAEPTQQKRPTPNASRSSGERGLGGEVLLSEKQPLPPESPVIHPRLLGREREGGDFSIEKSPPSQSISSTHSISAIASISQRTFLGRVLTAQQLRAGLLTKCFA